MSIGFRSNSIPPYAAHMIELVDFNTIYSANTKAEAAAKKPRTRRAGGKKKAEEAAAAPVAEDAKVPEAEAQAPEEKPAE